MLKSLLWGPIKRPTRTERFIDWVDDRMFDDDPLREFASIIALCALVVASFFAIVIALSFISFTWVILVPIGLWIIRGWACLIIWGRRPAK